MQHLLSPAAHGGRSAPPHEGAQGDRRSDLWAVRPLARSCRELRCRHGGQSVRLRRRRAALRGEYRGVLSPHAQERHLCELCRGAAAGRAQSRILREAQSAGADLAGRARGRCRDIHLRHEDARDRGRVFRRDLDRQPHPLGARPAEAGGDVCRAGQRAGAQSLVAPAVLPEKRIRQPARLAVRRKRLHGARRERACAVGARLCHGRRGARARDLHQDARPLLRQSSVERALLVEAPPHRRAREPARAGERRRPDPGGARSAGAARRARGDAWPA